MLETIKSQLPFLLTISPITMSGAGIIAICTIMYMWTKLPEFLIIIGTALIYSAVPLIAAGVL